MVKRNIVPPFEKRIWQRNYKDGALRYAFTGRAWERNPKTLPFNGIEFSIYFCKQINKVLTTIPFFAFSDLKSLFDFLNNPSAWVGSFAVSAKTALFKYFSAFFLICCKTPRSVPHRPQTRSSTILRLHVGQRIIPSPHKTANLPVQL